MKIYNDIHAFSLKKPVVTVGIFDGVHIGHKAILSRTVQYAKKINTEPVMVTLWPHPRKVLDKEDNIKFLHTIEEKIKLLQDAGIMHLIVLRFTKEFAALSASEFIKKILVDSLDIQHLIVGYNHKFGHDRQGDIQKLQEYAHKYNFTVEQVPATRIQNINISSSKIRKMLREGNISLANSHLGYAYSITGEVTGGSKVGRLIGFPTANILPGDPDKLIPKDGVYAVKISMDKSPPLKGMLNIGYKPTVNNDRIDKSIEVHIFEFNKDIYHQTLTLIFIDRLRDEMKFENIEQLKKQLTIDKQNALKVLSDV